MALKVVFTNVLLAAQQSKKEISLLNLLGGDQNTVYTGRKNQLR